MERLTGIDAAFLSTETPTQHMHALGVTVLDPTSIPGGFDPEAARAETLRRMMQQPALRRRLVQFPLGLDLPAWVETSIDCDAHVIRASLPAPGTRRQFEDFVGQYLSVPLPRDRPLWQACLLEGLEGGRVALLVKIHHCIVDGGSGMQLMGSVYDASPTTPPPAAVPDRYGRDEEQPSPWSLLGEAVAARAGDPLRAVSLAASTVASLGRTLVEAAASRRAAPVLTAPATPFSHALTPRRSVTMARASLADVKAVREHFGCTVNDVVLAACSIALRSVLESRGALPERPLVASVPVSLRSPGEQARSFNRVTAMFVALPVQVKDPLGQLQEVRRASAEAKSLLASVGKELLGQWMELLPPFLLQGAMRLYSSLGLAELHPPLQNLVVSNVRGPSFPIYAAGAKAVEIYPLGPILEGAGLNVTVFSYEDSLNVGIAACPDLLPDVDAVGEGIARAIVLLRRLAGG